MKEIKLYKIVEGEYTHELYNNVHGMINEGWQPYGNVYKGLTLTSIGNLADVICQTMVKYK